MIGKKINQLATELAPVSTDLTIIGDPISGVSKKITLAQLGAIFSGAVSFYTDLASFPATGDINVIYCAKDTQKLYLWSGSAYTEVFPSQALLDTYQLRSEKGNANGYASLDSGGKVPISQLPSSIMEYKGMWNAATNTPTLANGTGDTGDVYICNVAGTVDFGAGAITFAVGDYVIYSGSIWQRSSGSVGTVTSVAATITGDSVTISGSPVTTSGTLAFAFNGTTAQYIRGNGTLETFPSLTGFVPYTGATANVNLGTFDLTADVITGATGSYTSSGGGNTLEVTHSSGSGIALNITKGGNGEGLYINKTSGSGNAATIIGTLNATTLVKSGGTSSQFLKADGSVDSNTYVTIDTFETITASKNFALGLSLGSAGGTNQASVFQNTSSLFSGSAGVNVFGFNSANNIYFGKGSDNGGVLQWSNSTVRYYTLPNATGTLALTSDLTGGTVTSVGLSSATSGVTIGSTPITTSGTITLAIATASGSQQGLLSSTDWTTFNNKQNALTNPVTGTGTTNYLPKFTGASTIGNSLVFDNGTNVGIGTATPSYKLDVSGAIQTSVASGNGSLYINNSSLSGKFWTLIPETASGETNLLWYYGGAGASVKMNLTNTGNLGLGVTPSAWDTYKAFQIGSQGSLASVSTVVNLSQNAYWSASGHTYIATGTAAQYHINDGVFAWRTAPSGTAGNAISFTQAMTLNASGRLLLNTTDDNAIGRLQVRGNGTFTGTGYDTINSAEVQLINTTSSTGRTFVLNSLNSGGFQIADKTAGGATRLLIDSTGAATFSSSINAGGYVTGQGAQPGGLGGSRWVLDYFNGTRLFSYGADTSTNGSFAFNSQRSNGTNSIDFLTLSSSGAATFSSSLTTGGNVFIPNGNYYYAKRNTSGDNINVLGFASGSDTLTIKGGTSGSAASIQFADTGGTIATFYNSNFGIGTTSPSHPLSVLSNSSANAIAIYGRSSDNTGSLDFFQNNGTTRLMEIGISPSAAEFYYDANSPMIFYTNATERMRITSGGNTIINPVGGNGVYSQSLLTIKASVADGNQIHMVQFNDDRGWRMKAQDNGHFYLQSTYQNSNSTVITANYDTGLVQFASAIKTGAPTNGTAETWKLGDARSGSISTDSYIIVSVNGVTYSIPALNGLP
jgi:hypothetical protein